MRNSFSYIARRFVKTIGNLIAPPFCAACKKFLSNREPLCLRCKELIHPVASITIPITKNHDLKIFAVSLYQEPIKSLILAKSSSQIVASAQLGALMWDMTHIRNVPFDFLIPVPLHWARFAKRGYNQAEEIATVLSQCSGKPVVSSLVTRIKNRPFQSALEISQREENVSDVFELQALSPELYLGKEALVAFISVQCILANLFVIKQISLFGLTATCSDAYSIGAVLGLNLLQEYYGRTNAQRAIVVSFLLLVFYASASYVHCSYAPCPTDTMHPYFSVILDAMPRIVLASFSVYLFVQWIDSLLYGWLQRFFNGRYLVARTAFSIAITQLIDTVLFSFTGLFGLVDHLGQIIIVSYGIKLAAIAIATPLVGVSKRIMSRDQIK